MAVAAVAMVFVPYIWGYLNVPRDMVFMGFADHPYDQNSYLSRIQQASEGKFFIKRDFTLEPQRPLFFNPFTWTLGVIVRLTGLSPLAAYYGAIVFYALLLFYVIWWFIGIFSEDPRQRLVAFALCAFSSGLCWIIPYGTWERLFREHGMVPIDYWIAETITFETIFSFPQFALTAALMLFGFGFFIEAAEGRLVSRSIYGGLALFALCFVHTVDMVTVGVVIGVYCLLSLFLFRSVASKILASGILIALVALPAFLYMYRLFTTEPVFVEWSKEKFTSPHPLSYIIGYGLVLFLAVPELIRVLKSRDRAGWLLAVWVIAVAVLLYAPLSFQRRLSTAVHIPLCILAARTVSRSVLPAACRLLARGAAPESTGTIEAIVLALIVAATFPANIVKVLNCIREMRSNPLEFYLPRGDVEAMRWMKENHNEDAAVLSTYKSGLYLPAYTGNRVYVGHWSETLRFNEKAAIADTILFSPGDAGEKAAFLREHDIKYIYFGNFERMRGRFAMEGAPCLRKIYGAGGVNIYKVEKTLSAFH